MGNVQTAFLFLKRNTLKNSLETFQNTSGTNILVIKLVKMYFVSSDIQRLLNAKYKKIGECGKFS